MRLPGKRAIITGSSRGIGAGIAQELVAEGARVVINTHDPAEMPAAEALTARLDAAAGAGTAHAIRADISVPDQAERLIRTGADRLGGLDILIHNAGVESTVAAMDLDLAEWDRVMNTNLRGGFVCARAAARRMVADGRGGVILFTSSIHESVSRLGLTHYAVSKAGLRMLGKALALEWAEHGIRVLGIAPGAIETDANAAEIAAFGKHRFEDWIPLSRLGRAADVAKVAAFLVSDDAGYITGTTLEIDGGYVLNLVRYDPRKG
ncbi:SDR family NAD(P)-dependent oxidoreductase [Psychromarinibacter sp. C21-152]|uniref:SDR family NAD(P)-dependent oxidoreductase n=1 Tax=Psychromarinibacter sediminicola TaxID=3033385 RepID=A0AAE3T887_9RHOB|nr:SDR family NAD(P)-dependent oxidoreductase [Psychromarinibacter sediminicola]MDF0599829.1 SDR family NAD(P)-dependent oxidoreductase [Psychromarinibacter sediminicola]